MFSSSPILSQPVIPSTRLEWLCQPQQLAGTLTRLAALTHWQKACHLLLYADRQGLLEVQALVVGRAWFCGTMQAVAYHDGSAQFPGALRLDHLAERVARGVLQHIHDLCEPDFWPPQRPEGDRVYQRWMRPLCKRLTGHDFPQVAEAATALDASQFQMSLQMRLDRLVTHAQQTRRPLPQHMLTRLCVAPVDLLPIRDNRWSTLDGYDTWDRLAPSDHQKLDPEGTSFVVFQAADPTITGTCTLPFRRATRFLASDTIRALPMATEAQIGQFLAKPPDPEVLCRAPVAEMMRELGVAVERVCPYCLQDKAVYLAQPAVHRLRWPTIGRDQLEWADDPWDGLVLPPLEPERRDTR